MAHYDVIIATPGRSLDMNYVRSLVNTIKELEKRGISWFWANQYCPHVSFARDFTFDQFKDFTYNKLFWIDSDISWSEIDFLSLYYSDKDIISGLYVTTGNFTAAHKHDWGPISQEEADSATGDIEILHCGFGFLCIKYNVATSIPDPQFISSMTNQINGFPKNEKFIYLPEDVSWCLNANKLGYKIYLDPNVRVGHHKIMRLGW